LSAPGLPPGTTISGVTTGVVDSDLDDNINFKNRIGGDGNYSDANQKEKYPAPERWRGTIFLLQCCSIVVT
jgi:hypothetical protein